MRRFESSQRSWYAKKVENHNMILAVKSHGYMVPEDHRDQTDIPEAESCCCHSPVFAIMRLMGTQGWGRRGTQLANLLTLNCNTEASLGSTDVPRGSCFRESCRQRSQWSRARRNRSCSFARWLLSVIIGVEPDGVFIVIKSVECHSQDSAPASAPASRPDGHLAVQTVEFLIGKNVGQGLLGVLRRVKCHANAASQARGKAFSRLGQESRMRYPGSVTAWSSTCRSISLDWPARTQERDGGPKCTRSRSRVCCSASSAPRWPGGGQSWPGPPVSHPSWMLRMTSTP